MDAIQDVTQCKYLLDNGHASGSSNVHAEA